MTCIIGLVDNGNVYMGGDSAGVAGKYIRIRKDKKVFLNGEFIFGFTSSFRMGDILKYHFDPPEHLNNISTDKYMATEFVRVLRWTLESHWHNQVKNKDSGGGQFLVGYKGRLFNIGSDFQVGENYFKYDAVGSGEPNAMGAMFALWNVEGYTPEQKIKLSLKAASVFSTGVAPPFTIKVLRGKK